MKRITGFLPFVLILGACSGMSEVADFSPRFSPDGERIVFSSDRDGEEEIYELHLSTGEVERLTDVSGVAADPTYAPDGRSVLFAHRPPGRTGFELAILVNGVVSYPFMSPEHRIAFPDLGPDNTIVMACVNERTFGICTLSEGNNNPVMLFDDPSARDWEPVWSPDGSQIAFVSDRDGDDEIFVMDSDGSNVRQVTVNEGKDADPAFSPDGQEIAFSQGSENHLSVAIMSVDGSNQRQLVEGARPSWAPDGELIVFYTSFIGRSAIGVALATVTPDGSSQAIVSQREWEEWSPPGWLLLVIVVIGLLGMVAARRAHVAAKARSESSSR